MTVAVTMGRPQGDSDHRHGGDSDHGKTMGLTTGAEKVTTRRSGGDCDHRGTMTMGVTTGIAG